MTHPFFAGDHAAVVGANIRRRREDLGLAVPHLAARLGMAPDRLAAAEAGTVHLAAGELLAVMQRLRCSLPALFAEPVLPGASS